MGRPSTKDSAAMGQQILRMRKRGMSFYSINESLGITCSNRIFAREIAKHATLVEQTVKLEEARLDDLTRSVWDAAITGDLQAVDRALKIMERRARLLGLDFSDKMEGKRLQLEEARIHMVAIAFSKALDVLQVNEQQRALATTVLLSTLRAIPQAETELLYAIEA